MRNHRDRKAGISLIELLVVVAIIGLLAVAVLPNLTATTADRRSREAARNVSSYIAKAHGAAIGRKDNSGFTIRPTNATSSIALEMFRAEVPPPYRGDTAVAKLAITSGSSLLTRLATGTDGQLASILSIGVQPGDLIRFEGRDPVFVIDTSIFPLTGTSIPFSHGGGYSRESANPGESLTMVPWPVVTGTGVGSLNGPLSFEIYRRPVTSGSPFTLPDGLAIDLFWSGMGPPGAGSSPSSYVQFETAGTELTVLFDGTGAMQPLVERSPGSICFKPITGPLFLLVGRADRVGNPAVILDPANDSAGANWQYADSYWVAIDPATGAVKVAECRTRGEDQNNNGVLDSGEDENGNGTLDINVVASQGFIRQALLAGGR